MRIGHSVTMSMAQKNITSDTPMGGNLVDGGATFRVWAPCAHAVHVVGDFNGNHRDDSTLLTKDEKGYWTGFASGAVDGARYVFHIVGDAGEADKRDPYARELTVAWPDSKSILRDPRRYRWRAAGFGRPEMADAVLYQLHVGSWSGPDRGARAAKFLDVALRAPHLAGLGVTAVQLMPVVEFQAMYSMGYNGTDYFSPEMDYGVQDGAELERYRTEISQLFAHKGATALGREECEGADQQLRILVDTLHLFGIAVIFDVVYNHAGGGWTDGSIYFFDCQQRGDDNRSLYFTDRQWAGGNVFAFWKQEVRQFLIDNAGFYLRELHADGFRYDEVSVIDRESAGAGWRFAQDLASTVRAAGAPLQIAEYWPMNPWVVKAHEEGGAGFDATLDDSIRNAVRAAVAQASYGAAARVDMHSIATAIESGIGPFPWQRVTCVESQDAVYAGRGERLPALADSSNHRSWYARSRARVASALVLTAPGTPMIFMGQELLEDKQWSDDRDGSRVVWWGGLESGERAVVDHLRFMQDAIRLRREQPALRRGSARAFHVHDENRVLAFHRWVEGEGRDVIVVGSLNDSTFDSYRLGFPGGGAWRELFNSDVYDNFVNPAVAGNGGRIVADGPPLHGFGASAAIVIPANGVVVFARA